MSLLNRRAALSQRHHLAPRVLGAGLALGVLSCAAVAAPLDALLSTEPAHVKAPDSSVELELGYDVANDRVDFLRLRPDNASSSTGDYYGRTLRAAWDVTPRLRVDGGLTKRRLVFKSFDADVTTWQVAAQYLVLGAEPGPYENFRQPQLALRASAWGDSASGFDRELNYKLGSTTFRSLHAEKPRDTQLQFDVIAGWPVNANLHVNGIAGIGYSKVTLDSVSGTAARSNGDLCDVQLTHTVVSATCINAKAGSKSTLTEPSNDNSFGVDINKEARYHALTYQAGINATWRSGDWLFRGGLLHMTHRRSDVEDVVRARGGSPVRSNQVLLLEAGYKPTNNSLVFLRGQMMTHQFLGELPMTYNSVSAGQFDKRYGFVTLGLAVAF
jgi:hypothetical protein